MWLVLRQSLRTMGDFLDVQETPVGLKADLPQGGRFLSNLPISKSRVLLMVVSMRSARPSL